MKAKQTPQWATLAEIRGTILPGLMSPVPSNDTVRAWLDAEGAKRLKANQGAKRGGGRLYYLVSDVERVFSKFSNGQ